MQGGRCQGDGLSCCEAITRVEARREDGRWKFEVKEGNVRMGPQEGGRIDEVTEEGGVVQEGLGHVVGRNGTRDDGVAGHEREGQWHNGQR